jgi:hypothetical protein
VSAPFLGDRTSAWMADVAWVDAVDGVITGFIHLSDKRGQTLCGKKVGGTWISRSRGLFFKKAVLQRHDGQLCPVCLEKSGGRGPISRRGRA